MVDIFEKDIDLPWYPDEIIGRPGDLKSQRLQGSSDETCEESARSQKDKQDMDVFDALRIKGAEVSRKLFWR